MRSISTCNLSSPVCVSGVLKGGSRPPTAPLKAQHRQILGSPRRETHCPALLFSLSGPVRRTTTSPGLLGRTRRSDRSVPGRGVHRLPTLYPLLLGGFYGCCGGSYDSVSLAVLAFDWPSTGLVSILVHQSSLLKLAIPIPIEGSRL